MRLFLAAVFYNGVADQEGRRYTEVMNNREREIVKETTNFLESYHYIGNEQRVEIIRKSRTRVFLDSGAFSAFTLGKKINLSKYCEYIKQNVDILEVASVLDGIGNALETYQHQCYMEQSGVWPLPCFHYGEDERYLEYYIERYPYITLGGMVPNSTKQNKIWLDRIWNRYLTNEDGKPKIKVHGFGMTSVPLMFRYPWHSVDSSSWVQIGSMGNIFLPGFGTISLSEKSPSRKVANQHFETLSKTHKNAIAEEIEKRGFTIERLKEIYTSRWVFNILIYKELEKQLNSKEITYKQEQKTLF